MRFRALLVVVASASAGCSSSGAADRGDPSPPAGASVRGGDAFDVPLAGSGVDVAAAFARGDALFDLPFREADGLGPLYVRAACGACHDHGVRGPGLVQKMAVVGPDGVTPAPDPTILPFGNTLRPLLAAGATTAIVPPPGDARVKVTIRIGPPVLGRGYLEAVQDSEIERVAALQAARGDGIHGRVNRVVYASEANPAAGVSAHAKGDVLIGRFGLKARIATLDDFTADAFQGDMGITSPMRPVELPNPDALDDDRKPGVDVALDHVNDIAAYLRTVAIPRRGDLGGAGRDLFERAQCSACHVPSLRTRDDYPVAALAAIDAPIFTDLLLHDLGDALADGLTDGDARSREWRTAPLIGLRFVKSYLHDGRARTVREAIGMHGAPGSEASASAALFEALGAADQQTLLDFVDAL